jgi:thioredoxin family protein
MPRFAFSFCLLWFACAVTAGIAPLTVKDISLMLRSGYSSEVVLQELSKRKFAETFDSAGEKQLVQAGASQSLISTLRSGVYQLSVAEIAAAKNKERFEADRQSITAPVATSLTNDKLPPAPSVAPVALAGAQIGGTMYDHLKDDLVYWHEGSFVPFDDETLQNKKFYLLFFSAFWSKDGRQFTSRLVDYYNRVAPQHPELEVIFFSADRSSFAMQNYFSQTNMPWPAVAYDKRDGKAGAIAGSLVRQIPCLILSDATGRILSRTDENSGPDKVLADLDKVLAGNK